MFGSMREIPATINVSMIRIKNTWQAKGTILSLLFVVVFGAVSVAQAGVLPIVFEAEDGSLAGQVQKIDDPLSAGGQALQFTNYIDLASYYPNHELHESNYLEGFNYTTEPSGRSVLWFEKLDQWSFRLYNSAPEHHSRRCNWDQLSWWDDDTLRYAQTHHECSGSTSTDIVYENPIIFLPRYWEVGSAWSFNGSTPAKFYVDDELRCSGTNTYTAEIIGQEEIAPGEIGIHWRTTQTTFWDTGDVVGGCFAGYTTHWQEDYWLSDKLPVPDGNGVTKGLKRSKGGNLDNNNSSWDVWFDKWQELPEL